METTLAKLQNISHVLGENLKNNMDTIEIIQTTS